MTHVQEREHGPRLFQGIRPFSWSGAVRDALAGFTLAAMNVPQALGYTKIAGMPVVTGLYTVLLPLAAFATFGSSRYLVVGADSATAAILAGELSHMAPIASPHYVALAGLVALLTAGCLLLARLFRLGFLADFLSQTVLVGFLTGVGIQVGVAVLGEMLGVLDRQSQNGRAVGPACPRFAAGSRADPLHLGSDRGHDPPLPPPRTTGARTTLGGCRGSRGEPRVQLFRAWHQRNRAGSGRPASARAAGSYLVGGTSRFPSGGLLLPHDRRSKRGDGACLCVARCTRYSTRTPIWLASRWPMRPRHSAARLS